jgi:hypothetical protein
LYLGTAVCFFKHWRIFPLTGTTFQKFRLPLHRLLLVNDGISFFQHEAPPFGDKDSATIVMW